MTRRRLLVGDPYRQGLSDRQYLWYTNGPAKDMTGGYVDQDDLETRLKAATKMTATQYLTDQIIDWYRAGPERGAGWFSDPRGNETARRYDVTLHAHGDLAGGLDDRPPLTPDRQKRRRMAPVTPGQERLVLAAFESGLKPATIARDFRLSRAQVVSVVAAAKPNRR